MRILLIANHFPPDVNSTGQLMADLAARWLEWGHAVSVVTSMPHYKEFRIDAPFRRKLYQRERAGNLDILRLRVYAPGRKSMLNRLVNYLTFTAGAALAGLLRRDSWDVILCTNGAFFTGIAAWLIGALKGIPFIYNVQDLYPEVPVAAGQLRNRRAIRILHAIEAFMYRKARRVSVISAAMRDNLIGKNVAPKKIAVIPNFVDCEFIRPLTRKNDFSRRHGLDDKFVVMHAGNLGYVYDFDSLLDSAKTLIEERGILFVIVGDGVAKAALQRRAQEIGLPNVLFMPFQPREQLPWLRASADVQLSLYKAGAARHSMPSKIYEILASGRPLLASAERASPVGQLIADTECGVCIEPQNAEQLTAAIRKLRDDAQLRDHLAANGRRAAEMFYDKTVVANAYERLLTRVAEGAAIPFAEANGHEIVGWVEAHSADTHRPR
jgi:colanic acid biosynthesis glycosyl transferase WcaI